MMNQRKKQLNKLKQLSLFKLLYQLLINSRFKLLNQLLPNNHKRKFKPHNHQQQEFNNPLISKQLLLLLLLSLQLLQKRNQLQLWKK